MRITETFETWHAFNTACHRIRPIFNTHGSSDETGRHAEEFTGTRSWEHAEEIALSGDTALEARVRGLINSFESVTLPGERDNTGMTTFWDVAGDEPDIERYLSGEPENMVQYVPDERIAHGKIVSIGVSMCNAANIEAGTIERKGAAVVALIDLIEQSGRRAEVCVCWGTEGGSIGLNSSVVRVNVKASHEPLDFTRLVYCLAHPSMQRRHFWRLAETTQIKVAGTHYGKPNHKAVKEACADCDLFLGSESNAHIGATDKAAHAWLTETVNKIMEGEL